MSLSQALNQFAQISGVIRLDERLAENERKQAEKQAEPDMEETWDLSDPADPLNIGMGWGTGGHGLGL